MYDCSDFSNINNYWLQYEGEFKDGKMWGKGNLDLTNEEKFQGEFEDGTFHGEGYFYKLNGDVVHGIWNQGELV